MMTSHIKYCLCSSSASNLKTTEKRENIGSKAFYISSTKISIKDYEYELIEVEFLSNNCLIDDKQPNIQVFTMCRHLQTVKLYLFTQTY